MRRRCRLEDLCPHDLAQVQEFASLLQQTGPFDPGDPAWRERVKRWCDQDVGRRAWLELPEGYDFDTLPQTTEE